MIEARSYVVRTDGWTTGSGRDTPYRRIKPENGKYFELSELQTYVGGMIELVDHGSSDHVMFINEEGKLESPPLGVNIPATMAWDYEGAGTSDVIVGDAVIIHKHHLVDWHLVTEETDGEETTKA